MKKSCCCMFEIYFDETYGEWICLKCFGIVETTFETEDKQKGLNYIGTFTAKCEFKGQLPKRKPTDF